MVSAAYKNRTRDEIIAAFRESIRRKQEWQKRAGEIVSDYYARKAEEGMNRLWETGQWSKEKDDEVMSTHLRTPYKHAK